MLASALIADGPPSRLLEEAIAGRIELVLPELVLDEPLGQHHGVRVLTPQAVLAELRAGD